MKKYFGVIVLAVLIGSTTLFVKAQDDTKSNTSTQAVSAQTFRGPNYVDKNNDGICDNRGNNLRRSGRNFIDKNNDGICDNYGQRKYAQKGQFRKNCNGLRHGRGNGKGNGNGQGNRRGNGNGSGNGNGNGKK